MLRPFLFLFFFLTCCGAHLAHASVSSGLIDGNFKNALVCHSVDCTTPTPGSINFKPTGTTAVTIDDAAGIDGIAWGNELGWITFDPVGPEGLTINTTTGVVSGKAWSQVGGWINFAPTGYGVTINGNGEFTGWAWVGGPLGGWIKFDCAVTGACVKTDWRPTAARPVVQSAAGNGAIDAVGGTGSIHAPGDVCWNIDGVQFSIPDGYEQAGTQCMQIPDDVCQNLVGVQTSIPVGYLADTGGLCIVESSALPRVGDADGDGIPDTQEQADSDGDTAPDYLEPNTIDTDGDGIPNHLDDNDDGDAYLTRDERTTTTNLYNTDTDSDGIPAYLDAIQNAPRRTQPLSEAATNQHAPQTQTDHERDAAFSIEQMLMREVVPSAAIESDDADADADGIPDVDDPVVASTPDADGGDSDGDGFPDASECVGGAPCPDFDADTIPNYLDTDDDNDGIPSRIDDDGDDDGVLDTVDMTPHGERTAFVEYAALQPAIDSGEKTEKETDATLDFAFVPSFLKLRVHAPALATITRFVFGGTDESGASGGSWLLSDSHPTESNPQVDVTGVLVFVGAFGAALFGLWNMLWWLVHVLYLRPWGVVYDAATRQALSGVTMYLYDNAGVLVSETTSNQSGEYIFRVRPGVYRMRAVKDRYMLEHNQAHRAYDGGDITIGSMGKVKLDVMMSQVTTDSGVEKTA